jgi:hypothetical protein
MYTPDSYNNDPARIMRAELRAARAEARDARMAVARNRPPCAETGGILRLVQRALRVQDPALAAHLAAVHAGSHAHGHGRCPHP